MSDFYRSFEDAHRGSRDLIKKRLEIYKPFITLLNTTISLPVVDLGCGRGEWLELLKEMDIPAHGVDLDDGMLNVAKERGLSATKCDALSYLKKLEGESQMVVSAFHLVEHVPFEYFEEIVIESLRVLSPGGVLILETPNPENMVVGTSSFYMDPSHVKPIPPDLMSFVPKHYGFARAKILRLQETKSLGEIKKVTLNDVFTGVSPDYSVIAQKTGSEDALQKLDSLFKVDFGVSLDSLVRKFDMQSLDSEQELTNFRTGFENLRSDFEDLKSHFDEMQHLQLQILTEIQKLKSSRSWRITAPLRFIQTQVRLVKEHGVRTRAKMFFRKVGFYVVRKIQTNSNFRSFSVLILRRTGLYQTARHFYNSYLNGNRLQRPPQTDIENLTPYARSILTRIKIAEKSKGRDY